MTYKDRIDKVQEIYKIAKDKNLNVSTLAFLLALYNDREFLKFYKEFKEKQSVPIQ